MKKIILSLSCIATLATTAQNTIDWPEAGKYRLDTAVSKTNVSKLMIAVGGFGQGAYSKKFLIDYGMYGYARFRIANIAALSAYVNQGFMQMPNGGGTSSHQEATATIYYMHHNTADQGIKVLEETRDGNYKTTVSAPYNYPASFFSGIGVSLINKKYFAPIVLANGVIKNSLTDSTVNYTSAVTQVNTQIVAFGITSSSSAKFKGKIYYTSTDGKRQGVYKIRKNTSIDMALQCLMALNTTSSPNLFDVQAIGANTTSDITKYVFTPQAYKKFGWRAMMVIRPNAALSMNISLGSLPGLKASNVKGISTLIENGYMQIGFGFGIGAIDSKRK